MLAKHMVIGGAGFLGSHIVGTLKARGDVTVGVFDLVQPSASESVEGVEYFTGDITDETRLTEVLKQVRALYHNHRKHEFTSVLFSSLGQLLSIIQPLRFTDSLPMCTFVSTRRVLGSSYLRVKPQGSRKSCTHHRLALYGRALI